MTVTDKCDPENKADVDVVVSAPATIRVLPTQLELQEGQSLDLHVVMLDGEGRSYNNCSSLSLATTVHGSSLAVLSPEGAAL